MPFLGTPGLSFVKVSQPMDVLAGFKVNVRPFCSESVVVGQVWILMGLVTKES